MRASWLECLRFFVAQKFLDAEDVTGLMIKHGCLPMPQRIEVYLEVLVTSRGIIASLKSEKLELQRR
jgi:hypothetical protein